MRALTRARYGAVEDVVKLREVERPAPGPGEVLVRVRASSVNPADVFLTLGSPFPVRLMAGVARPARPVLGLDVAGVVEAVGEEVTRFAPGDAVFGEIEGAFAEYACAPEEALARKAPNQTFAEAAAVPVAGLAALQGLRDKAKVQPGDHVAINGASGGVGTFAVQLAKAMGAEVTAVCSGRNAATARALGADHVVDYTREDFAAQPARYDAIFDLAGSNTLRALHRALRPGGVVVSSSSRMGRLAASLLAAMVPGGRVVIFAAEPSADDLDALRGWIEAGAVRAVIDRAYGLDDARAALLRQVEGHAQGKSVIAVHDADARA